MFSNTFFGTSVTSIPEDLFAGIDTTTPAVEMFVYTFGYCGKLTGPSAKINGRYLYEIWPTYPTESWRKSAGTYSRSTGLSDWNDIPDFWK